MNRITKSRGILLVGGMALTLVTALLIAFGQSRAVAQAPCQDTVLPPPQQGVVTATVALASNCFEAVDSDHPVRVGVVMDKPMTYTLAVEIYIGDPRQGGQMEGGILVPAGQTSASKEFPFFVGHELFVGRLYNPVPPGPGEPLVPPAAEVGEPGMARVVQKAVPPTVTPSVTPPTTAPTVAPPTAVPTSPTPEPPVCKPGQAYPGPAETPCRKPRPGEAGYEPPPGVKGPRSWLPGVSR